MNKLKRIISNIGITSFILAWGAVGASETGNMEFVSGVLLSTIFLAITGLCTYINHIIESESKHNREQIKHIQSDYCEYIMGMR